MSRAVPFMRQPCADDSPGTEIRPLRSLRDRHAYLYRRERVKYDGRE